MVSTPRSHRLAGPLDSKLSHFSGQRIPVDPELSGRFRQVAVGVGQSPLDETALEFAAAVFEVDAAGHHLVDQAQ